MKLQNSTLKSLEKTMVEWIHESQLKILKSRVKGHQIRPLKPEDKTRVISYLKYHNYFPFGFDILMDSLGFWSPRLRKLFEVPFNYDFDLFVTEIILYHLTRSQYVAVEIYPHIWIALKKNISVQDINMAINDALSDSIKMVYDTPVTWDDYLRVRPKLNLRLNSKFNWK
jgi:hypothetical protein